MSASLGIPGELNHPDYRAALDCIVQAAKEHDKSLGWLVSSAEEGHADLRQGFDEWA